LFGNFCGVIRAGSRESLVDASAVWAGLEAGLHQLQVMNVIIEQDKGTRPTAVVPPAEEDRYFQVGRIGGLPPFGVPSRLLRVGSGGEQRALPRKRGTPNNTPACIEVRCPDTPCQLPAFRPGLTANTAVTHNATAIKLGNSTIAVTMSEGPSTETGATAGKPLKVSVAQVLIYELRVRDAMTRPPVTAGPGDSLRTIQHLMKTHRISGVPILQNGALAGLVSIEDIINALDQGHVNDPAERWMTRNIVTLRDHFSR
jgi:hypothetical protein